MQMLNHIGSAAAVGHNNVMTPRAVARRVLERIERDDGWATPTLNGELMRAGLSERDRRLSCELVYGVLRHRLRPVELPRPCVH